MNVIQINYTYELSSTGRTTKQMHEFLLSKGINSFIFCRDGNIPERNIFKVGSFIENNIHALCSRLFGLQGYFSYFATKRMLGKFDKIKPTVVILRVIHSNFINMPLLLKYLAIKNIATIVVLHDCWYFTGHCCYYSEECCLKWSEQCHHCPILHKYNKSLFFDKSQKIFKDKKRLFQSIAKLAIVGVSDWITNEGKKSPIFTNAMYIERHYNWIDNKIFKTLDVLDLRNNLKIKNNDFVVLGVAQKWHEHKGLYVIIETANCLRDVIFVLVGRMPNVELPPNIITVGELTSQSELALYYSLADVFLNMSKQETFGKVAAEALTCGTPIIAYNTTANPELCGDGCGILIDSPKPEIIANAINEVRMYGKKRYTQRCRDFAVDNFDMDTIIDEYFNLFNRLTEPH